jgi:hypothetical protein
MSRPFVALVLGAFALLIMGAGSSATYARFTTNDLTPRAAAPHTTGSTDSPDSTNGPDSTAPDSTEPDNPGAPDAFGSAVNYGAAPAHLVKPVVGMAATSDGKGYWLVGSDGGIFSFGDAAFHGSMGGKRLNAPIVGMAPTTDRGGYWLVASDGGIFAFGDAGFHGSMGGRHLNAPVVGMAATSDGNGYWLVASDGGIFAFGDAAFHGSMGGRHLNAPVVGMAPTSDSGGVGGKGYWLVASDGGLFAFGDAGFRGSMGGRHLNAPVVAMAATGGGLGYWMVASDGGLFAFGNAGFDGSMAGSALANPVVAMAALPDSEGYWLLPSLPPPHAPAPSPPPPGCSAGFVCGHVTAIGDSVMLDAQPNLQADIPGIDVEAVVSRQWDDGVALAESMKAAGTLGSIVVVDLGTNGPVSLAQFQQMMSALAGASVVVFVTVHLPPSYSWWQSVNDTLEQGVPMYPNDRLADFNALADANPQWFGSDGVHMPIGGPGAQAMASLIASEI